MGPSLQVEFRLVEQRLATSWSSFSGALSGRVASCDFLVVIQQKRYVVRVFGRRARSKNKQKSLPTSPSDSSTNGPATRLERRMEAAQSIRN